MRGCILWIPNQRQVYPSAATDSAGLSSGTGEVEVFSLFMPGLRPTQMGAAILAAIIVPTP